MLPRRAALALILALAPAAGAPAPAAAEDAVALSRAMAAVGAKDWDDAAGHARASGALARDIVAWHALRAGQGSFRDYAAFAARNRDWPGMELLRERGEARLTDATPAAEVLAWFRHDAPLTGTGARQLLRALPPQVAARRAAEIWADARVPLSEADEAALRMAFPDALKPLHMARAEALLDQGEAAAARRLMPLLSDADADLVDLRADLQAGGPRLEQRVAALRRIVGDDAGLALDEFRWRVKAKDNEAARALMLVRSTSAEALRDPAAWAGRRADYARAALREGDAALALRLAAAHHLPRAHPAYVDLEWLAGYAALKTGDRAAARRHFEALKAASTSAITQSRALYWLARATEEPQTAATLMREAAAHQSTWYGQLAAEAAGLPMDPALAVPGRGLGTVPDWRGSALRGDRRVQAAIWLMLAGQPDLAQRFLLHTAETASGEDIARMARLMADLHQTPSALRLAKLAAQKGAVHPAVLFPLTGLESATLGIPPELALAVARRESEFNPRAGSPAGARGLMQVMPATAREIARDVGLAYDLDLLSTDPGYNALYGANYLAGLRARYGPSIALVAAGYNAGPGRSAQWLKAFGDIRSGADPVDWVESIPFDETRNYVMRVAEALPIYRARIAGQPVALTPTADLTGGGVTSVPVPRPVLTLTASQRPRAKPGAEAPEPVTLAAGVAPAMAEAMSLLPPGAAQTMPSIPRPPARRLD